MRAVVQRVSSGRVTVDQKTVGSISAGIVVLLGIRSSDEPRDVAWLAEKIVHLRIFSDDDGKMNRSLADIGGEMLIVSQFTLYGDCRKGRRPGYSDAAPPEHAKPLYDLFIERVEELGISAASGEFQAAMEVTIVNDGPVTLMLDSNKTF